MFSKKSILIISILAIFCLCISGISATEINDTNSNLISQSDNSQMNLNNSVYEDSNENVSEDNTNSFDVDNSTFFNYFGQDGFLNNTVVPEGSTVNLHGNFANITTSDGNILDGITFDYKVTVNGINATIYDTTVSLANDGIILNNLNFINSKQDAAIIIGGNNNAVNGVYINQSTKGIDSYGIYIDSVSNINLTNNNILFNGNENKTTTNFPIYINDASNILIENNSIDNNVPSVPLGYDSNYNVICYKGGIAVISSNKTSLKNNKIKTTYNNVSGSYDTLYNIFIKGSNTSLINNTIITTGNSYVYGVNINGIVSYGNDGSFMIYSSSFILDNNTIIVNGNNYANGIYVNGPSNGNITNNYINSTGITVSYPIASAAWSGAANVNYINNTIYGLANSVYGIELMGTNETVISNNITGDGNYTLGIASSGDINGLIIKDNNIILNGLGLSKPTTGDSISSDNIGIVVYKNSGIIEGNNISSSGYYGINLTSTSNNTVINNNIIANNTVGDYAVYNNGNNTVKDNIPIKNQSNIKIDIDDNGNIILNLTDSNGNPIPEANIKYAINGTEIGTITTDKKGIANITDLEGKLIFTVKYEGDKYFFGSDVYDSFILVKKAPERLATVIVSSDFSQTAVDFYHGERGGYFTVVLRDFYGNVLVNKPVSVGFNGVVYNLVTDDVGVAKLQINLAWSGIYTFAVAFLGDDDYNGSFVVNKITISPKVSSIAVSGVNPVKVNVYRTLTFTLKGVSALNSRKSVNAVGRVLTVVVNGKTYNLKTDKNGRASLRLRFSRAGVYTITTRFAGDGTFAAKSMTSRITVRR